MPINTLNKVINYFGSATQVAKVLGIKQQSVSDWYRGRSKVPLDVALHLDFLMRGEVDWKENDSLARQIRLVITPTVSLGNHS